MSTPETAVSSSQAITTIAAAARTVYPHDTLPDDVYARVRQAEHIERQMKAGAL
jgi:hypothetical protein